MNFFDNLITIELIRAIKSKGVSYRVRYELVDDAPDDKILYHCIYITPDTKEFGRGGHGLLVPIKLPSEGSVGRQFSFEALVRHHQLYGDGSYLLLDVETSKVTCIPRDRAKALEDSLTDS